MLVVDRDVYDALVTHAVRGAPEEVCGVLAGGFDELQSSVEAAEPTANTAAAPKFEYAIDPTEQLSVMNDIEDRGYEVVGFYHSHPNGPAGPSPTDADRASWPNRSYVIVDLAGKRPFVGAWRWADDDDRFVREVLTVR